MKKKLLSLVLVMSLVFVFAVPAEIVEAIDIAVPTYAQMDCCVVVDFEIAPLGWCGCDCTSNWCCDDAHCWWCIFRACIICGRVCACAHPTDCTCNTCCQVR